MKIYQLTKQWFVCFFFVLTYKNFIFFKGLFKEPTFDKTFQFGASIASDEEFYLRSGERFSLNNGENLHIKFDKRDETLSNNQLFNFSNNL